MQKKGRQLDLFGVTGKKHMGLLDANGKGRVFPTHYINDLTQCVTHECPPGEEWEYWRDLIMHEVPADISYHSVTAQQYLEQLDNDDDVPNLQSDSGDSSDDDQEFEGEDEDEGAKTYIVNPKMGRKELWHHKLMHVSEDIMDATRNHPRVQGLDWHPSERLGVCHQCPAGKAKYLPEGI